MKKIWGALLAAVLLLGVTTWIDYRKAVNSSDFKEELKPNEKEKVIIDQKKKTTTIIKEGKKPQVIIGGRNIQVSINRNNSVSVIAKTKGVLFEPGVSTFYSKDRFNLGLDLQLLYWRKYGLSTGLGFSRGYKFSAYLCSNWNFYSNTYLFLGVNDLLHPVVGVKVSF